MNIQTDALKAFLEIHQNGSFTKAAQTLGLSQSALSQKMARLEDMLQATLFIRKPGELGLTSAGEKLLIFAKQQLQLESDFLKDFNQYSDQISGTFRLAAFSSIVRSVLMPSLSPWLRKNQGVNVEFSSYEVIDLEQVLKTNKADAIVTDYFPGLPGLEEIQIGNEEYVLIENSKYKDIPNTFLDHGPHDNATESFFKFQGQESSYRRGFMGDVYAILDGVSQGLGKAIMSKHLVKDDKRFKIRKSPRKYIRPVVLSFYKQSYYSPIHQNVINLLQENAKKFL